MDLLIFTPKTKRGRAVQVVITREDLILQLGSEKSLKGILVAGSVRIYDEEARRILYDLAGFGERLNHLMDYRIGPDVSQECFSYNNEDESEGSENRMNSWSNVRQRANGCVQLSPEEVVFLVDEWRILDVCDGKCEKSFSHQEKWMNDPDFVKKYVLYRYLRNQGWCVRPGVSFGCNYLAYKYHQSVYHASAGVLLEDDINPLRLMAMTRILANSKKTLMVASIKDNNVNSQFDIGKFTVKITTIKPFSLNTEVPILSLVANTKCET